MKINIKKINEDAIIPKYSRFGDAGLDLTATTKYYDKLGNLCFGTGLAIEIPKNYLGLLVARSSVSKYPYLLANSIGVIDSNYRGELICKFKPSLQYSYELNSEEANNISLKEYNIGDRIAQLIILPYPAIEFNEVNELTSTERGDEGFGSSGK